MVISVFQPREGAKLVGAAAVPFSIGRSQLSQLFDNDLFVTAAGSFELVPHLPTSTGERLKSWAIRSKFSRLEVNPQAELAVNFDFSGVFEGGEEEEDEIQAQDA